MATDTGEQPKRSRRRRGRRGGQRQQEGAATQATDNVANEDAATTSAESDRESHRRRPADKRNEGRRRRQRRSVEDQPTTEIETASEATAVTSGDTVIATAPVEVASSETLTAAFTPETGEAPDAPKPEVESAPEVASTEPELTESAETPEANAPVATDEPQIAQIETTASSMETSLDEAPAEPEVTADTSGLTGDGRAINDPRVAPKPVTETLVTTEQGLLFWQTEAPPVTVIERDVARAINDPLGQRTTGSAEAS